MYFGLLGAVSAQSLTPSSVLLEATALDQTVSETFVLTPDSATISSVELCIPNCGADDVGLIILPSGESVDVATGTWSIDDNCTSVVESSCDIPVSYAASSTGESNAEVRVGLTDAAGSPLTLRASVRAVLTESVEVVSFPEQTFSQAEGTRLEIPVSRTVDPCCDNVAPLTVQIDVVPSASAIRGVDYELPDGLELQWAAGEIGNRTVVVDLLTDGEEETTESFALIIDPEQFSSGTSVEQGRAFIDIVNVPVQRGVVRFTTSTVSGNEGSGAIAVSVERIDGSSGSITVDVDTNDGTASAGSDYTAVSTTVTWADGETGTRQVSIPIAADSTTESEETFSVTLSGARGESGQSLNNVIVTPDVASVRIQDAGTPPPPTLSVRILSGDQQAALPGDTLDNLVVAVSDAANNSLPLAGTRVRWRILPEGAAAVLDGDVTVAGDNGQARNRIRVNSRGFIRVLVSALPPADATRFPETSAAANPLSGAASADAPTRRINPPPIDIQPNEAAFTVRAGIAPTIGLTKNQAEVGRALDSACEALDSLEQAEVGLTVEQSDLQSTCRSLEGRRSDGTLGTALDRLVPEELFVFADVVVDTADLQVTNVNRRIDTIRSGRTDILDLTGLQIRYDDQLLSGQVLDLVQDYWSGGDGAAADTIGLVSRFGFFASGAVSSGETDAGENQKSADFKTRGITIGGDYRLSSELVMGAAVGFVRNETDFMSDGDTAQVDGLSMTGFVTWYKENTFYVDAVLNLGRNDYSVNRRINLPDAEEQFATGDTNADVISAIGSVGQTFQLDGWELGPYARLAITQARVARYRESSTRPGAGVGSVLDVEPHTVHSTTLALGAQLSRAISTRRAVFLPQFRVEGEFENEDRKEAIEARFRHDPSSTAFAIDGNERDSAYVNVGVGTSVLLADRRSGYVFYESRTAHDVLTQHTLKFGLRLDF